MKEKIVVGIIIGALIVLGSIGYAAKPYEGVLVRVISQPRPEWDVIKEYVPEFEAQTGINVSITFFAEAERRAKERLDASTGTGIYQVYYLDETNVAEFGAAGWVLPILDYYPQEYDFDDFIPAWREIATYEGVPYFAPTVGMGDLLMYRKDVFAAAGYLVPKTLDEYLEMTKKLHHPPTIYGNVTRGSRATNWWRWGTFFYAFGGKYLQDNNPVFNSPEAVEATKYYMELVKYGPPGGSTFDWGGCIESFRAGKVVSFIDADVFYDWCEDPEKSNIVGKVGYAAPPAGPAGAFAAGCTHGMGISASGCKTEKVRKAAGLFIAWATSKQNEIRRLENGVATSYGRTSTLCSPQMAEIIPPFFVKALEERAAVTRITYMRRPQWPEIAENLGIILEELLTGGRTDIKAALDESVEYAKEALAR